MELEHYKLSASLEEELTNTHEAAWDILFIAIINELSYYITCYKLSEHRDMSMVPLLRRVENRQPLTRHLVWTSSPSSFRQAHCP
jgi:hypothetical protein